MVDANKLIRYFDLQSDRRTLGMKAQGGSPGQAPSPVIPQYCMLVTGIVAQHFLEIFRRTGEWQLGGFWAQLLFAIIVGVVIFPAIYKQSFDPEKPIFVQLCSIFAGGMGWDSLFTAAVGAATR
jgi:hypothetical protein